MLTKNIYILYPPGYFGTYVHWCISKSEEDLAELTVDDPMNKSDNTEFGGKGTAHLHTRVPTHQSLHAHLIWVAYNKPVEKKIYLINAKNYGNAPMGATPEWAISSIIRIDPDPVIIVINDGGSMDARKFGSLNTITKWPIFYKANQVIENDYKFDSFNCNDSIEDRNKFVEKFSAILPYSTHIDQSKLNMIIKDYETWYTVRNTHNGHEVNEETYIPPTSNIPNLFTISLTDISSPQFPNWFDQFLNKINAGKFNTDYIKGFHQNYIDAQDNLQWFNEIEEFRKNFILTEYLKSHSLIQAFIIMELRLLLPNSYDWKSKSIDEIVTYAIQRRV
jgi:hypothetical protein